ncbi:ankyrin [Neocallimastix lanati (nom. inval.)]|nr:ankyrin [Neocallimastix sp. JGI-2020a]
MIPKFNGTNIIGLNEHINNARKENYIKDTISFFESNPDKENFNAEEIYNDIISLKTVDIIKNNIKLFEHKYKNIYNNFILIIKCVENEISYEIIDFLLSKYIKDEKYNDLYFCFLMNLLEREKYDIIKLFLKNGFNINIALIKRYKYNLLFYLLDSTKYVFNNTYKKLEFLLMNGIDINTKVDLNFNNQNSVNNNFSIDKNYNMLCIIDLLISRIVSNYDEFYFLFLRLIINFYSKNSKYSSVKDTLINKGHKIKLNLDKLNLISYKLLAYNDIDLKVTNLFLSFYDDDREKFINSKLFSLITDDKTEDINKKRNQILNKYKIYIGLKEKNYYDNIDKLFSYIKRNKVKEFKEFLEEHQSLINSKNFESKTPLMYAAQYCFNNSEIFEILLNYNSNKDLIDNYGSTALHIACETNNYKVIPKLVTVNNINLKDKNGNTPLLVALKEYNYECLTALLSNNYKINVNEVDNKGNTPLMYAVSNFKGSTDIIDLLIKNGAIRDLKNYDGLTALHIACLINNPKAVPKVITENNADFTNGPLRTPLMIAFQENNYECIIGLLKSKYRIDVNIRDLDSVTPLMRSLDYYKKAPEMLDLIIKRGANKNLTNKLGITALHLACRANIFEAIPKLITNENINYKGSILRDTPISIAVLRNSYESVKLLLSLESHPVDLNITYNQENNTLLMIAVNGSTTEIIDLLINNGLSKDQINTNKSTALHLACERNRYDLIPKLITEKNVNFKDTNEDTPLLICLKKKHFECAYALLSTTSSYEFDKNNEYLTESLLYTIENKYNDEKIFQLLMKNKAFIRWKKFKKNINKIINNTYYMKFIITNGFYIYKDDKLQLITTPLIFSIQNNLINFTKQILMINTSNINEKDKNQKPALFYSIENKNDEYFKLIINCDQLNIEATNAESMNALMYALLLNEEIVIKSLLLKYIDIYERDINENEKLKKKVNENKIDNTNKKNSDNYKKNKDVFDLMDLMLVINVKNYKKIKMMVEKLTSENINKLYNKKTIMSHLIDNVIDDEEIYNVMFKKGAYIDYSYISNDKNSKYLLIEKNIGLIRSIVHNGIITITKKSNKKINIKTPVIYFLNNTKNAIVQLLLDYGASVNESDEKGLTPIFHAIKNNNIRLCELLLKKYHADITVRNDMDQTPLQFISHLKKCSSIVKKKFISLLCSNNNQSNINSTIVDSNVNTNSNVNNTYSKSNDITEINLAIKEKNYKSIKMMIKKLTLENINNIYNGKTIMCQLIDHVIDDEEIYDIMFKKGAYINRRYIFNNWLNHLIVSNAGLIKSIVRNGINVKVSNNDEILHSETPVIFSVLSNKINLVETLLNHGGSIEETDEEGNTPIFYAIKTGNTKLTRLFLTKYNPDISKKNKNDLTPLEYALELKHYDKNTIKSIINELKNYSKKKVINSVKRQKQVVYKMFIKEGRIENVNKYYNGKTIMSHLIDDKVDNEELFNLLFSKGAYINPIYLNDVPKKYFLIQQNKGLMKSIIRNGLIIGTPNNRNDEIAYTRVSTPVMYFIKHGKISVAKGLLENNANANEVDEEGFTPLFQAIKSNHSNIFSLLLNKFNADVTHKNKKGQTPLMYALQRNPKSNYVIELQEYNKRSSSSAVTPSSVKGNSSKSDEIVLNSQETIKTPSEMNNKMIKKKTENMKDIKEEILIKEKLNDTNINQEIPNNNNQINNNPLHGNENNNNKIYTEEIQNNVKKPQEIQNNNKNPQEIQNNDKSPQEIQNNDKSPQEIQNNIKKPQENQNNDKNLQENQNNNVNPQEIQSDNKPTDYSKNVDNNDNKIEDTDQFKYPELHYACIKESIEFIPLFIESEVYDINSKCFDGSTPLLVSIKFGKIKSIEELLKYKPDFTIPDNTGETPLSYLLKHPSPTNNNILFMLIPSLSLKQTYSPYNLTPFYYLIKYGNKEGIRKLSQQPEFIIDELNEKGDSVLFYLVKQEPVNLELVELLLQLGANVNFENREPKVPLIYAIERQNIKLVRLLLKYKADINYKLRNSLTPLKYTVIINSITFAKELLSVKNNKKVIK